MGRASFGDAPRRVRTDPGVACTWSDLGTAIGSVGVGLRRIEVPAGERPTPPHDHHAEEEIFYVLAGAGLAWLDGVTHEVRAGDCLVHLPRAHAHTLVAGAEGLDVLAFGERRPAELCVLPRTGHGWLGDSWVRAGEGDSPWVRDAARGMPELPPPSPRPACIVNVADVPSEAWGRGAVAAEKRRLGTAAGSLATGLVHLRVPPGHLAHPPHCHAAEEEIFVVLEGGGTLHLGDEVEPVAPGDVIGRPPGSRVAHALRAGDDGLVALAYGSRVPDDVCWYPRSRKLYFRGLGVIVRADPVGYWDGEDHDLEHGET